MDPYSSPYILYIKTHPTVFVVFSTPSFPASKGQVNPKPSHAGSLEEGVTNSLVCILFFYMCWPIWLPFPASNQEASPKP